MKIFSRLRHNFENKNSEFTEIASKIAAKNIMTEGTTVRYVRAKCNVGKKITAV